MGNGMSKPLKVVVLIVALFSLTSLAWAGDSQGEGSGWDGKMTILHLSDDYVIGQGDVIEVFVWRNDQLSREVVVRPDGKISLPLLQDIQAEGFTVVQLKNQITRLLTEHLDNPRVSVIIKAIKSYRVSVLGRVRNPGVYPITGKTTLAEAIALAGGFTEWADKGDITVVSNEGGEEKKVVINYKKIASGKDPSQNIILRRGDIIIVP
jgi:polysaccharide export outer membrane protein